MIVSYLPVEALDVLIAETGFKVDHVDAEYKFRWLKERIKILREQASTCNIVHDNPKISDLVAVIEQERRYSAAQRQTIETLQHELERKHD